MGVVYEALDRERRRLVALKTLRHSSPAALYLFKKEFRTLADVQHPNLVQLYELVVAETDRAFFTMELVRGADFLTYVLAPARTSSPGHPHAMTPAPRPSARLRPALRQLVEGVRALHRAGKLHRDIKPSNVRVTPEGRVVLLDFGVATELTSSSGDHARIAEETAGTARYMAPELPAGEPPTAASDWYSVGIMLDEALAQAGPADLEALRSELLQREPARRPSGAEIARRLGDPPPLRALGVAPSVPGSWPPSAGAAAFVGRDRALDALRDALEAVRGGASIAVRVSGGAGLGKSALVHHFLDEVTEGRRALVLRGRAYERESVPYKAMDSVVDALSLHLLKLADADAHLPLPADTPALARLFPVLLRVPALCDLAAPFMGEPQRVRWRAFSALRELLASLARRQPVVLFVDDAHWGDADSASLVMELMRPPEPPSILLIFAYRDAEAAASPFLTETAAHWPESAEVRTLPVGPLEPEDALDLARALLGPDRAEGRAAGEIARESGGNPILLDELARCDRAGVARAGQGPVTVEQMVSERLARLPDEARRVLEVVAVGGWALPLSIVAEASGVHDGLHEAIASARAHRFLRTGLRAGREVVEASHDRIRHTIVSQLSAADVREHHRRLALVLSATEGVDPETVAAHFLGAGEREEGVRFAERAAELAESALAFDRAARLYRLTLEHLPPDASRVRDLRRRLGRVLEWAGRGADAAGAYLEAARGVPDAARVPLERAAAEQLLASGHIDDGAEVLRRVLRAVGARAPRSPFMALLRLLAYQAVNALISPRFERGRAPVEGKDRLRLDALYSFVIGFSIVDVVIATCMQARHMLLALRAGDTTDVLRAAAIELTHVANRGGPVGRRERQLVALLDRLSLETDDAESLAFVRAARGATKMVRGQWREAIALLDGAYTNVLPRHAGWQSNAEIFAMLALYTMGDLRAVERRHARLLPDAELRGDLYTSVSLRTVTVPALCLAHDQPDEARRHVREAMAQWSHRGFLLQHWYAMRAEADIELYVGEPRRAHARVLRDARALNRSFLLVAQFVRVSHSYLLARCAIACVAAAEAGTSASRRHLRQGRRLASRLKRERLPHAAALSALLQAGIASVEGDRDRAVRSLREAIELSERATLGVHVEVCRFQLGVLLGGDEGRELRARGEAALAALGVRAVDRFAAMVVPGRFH
jgi:tetratricopeptide (TPR) repeat protein